MNPDRVNPDGPAAKAANPSLAQRNAETLRAFAAAREARGMSSTQGPHNRTANQAPYLDKSPAPRSG